LQKLPLAHRPLLILSLIGNTSFTVDFYHILAFQTVSRVEDHNLHLHLALTGPSSDSSPATNNNINSSNKTARRKTGRTNKAILN
jgi:hypothetical protein